MAFLIGTAVCNLVSQSMGFLNLSSHQQLYCGPAHPGLPRRLEPLAGAAREVPGGPIPGDDISLADYRPWAHGGPLHLMNVTVNETHGGETQVEQRDRKGMNLAVGPGRYQRGGAPPRAVGGRGEEGPARGGARPGYRVFPGEGLEPEELSLG